MSKEIRLKPGYDPDKYRDELCKRGEKIRSTMTSQEYITYINERGKELSQLIKSGNVADIYKPEIKETL
ncbi:MAG: hypothetical protein FWG98_06540 [Candidatus Cloacimonetes bacterium]|nr:hypothetical protein [Candidatus Cloacimonadota bacterium]